VEEFRPESYHDQVRERILEEIERKVNGQEISTAPPEAPQTKVIDLMDALKASLAKRGAATEAKKPAQRVTAASEKESDKEEKEPAAKPKKKASGAR
jgi:DNA end-binding protein Ku